MCVQTNTCVSTRMLATVESHASGGAVSKQADVLSRVNTTVFCLRRNKDLILYICSTKQHYHK